MVEPPSRKELLEGIVDAEWRMFHAVKAAEPAACQEEEGTFRLMRWMSHCVLPDGILELLLANVEEAAGEGRNLMTEKYARMEDKIPPLRSSPLIGDLVQAEVAWMERLHLRYPLTFPGAGDRFEAYLSCELETYSEPLLEAVHAFAMEARAAGRNLVEERYAALFKRLGYDSIEAREHKERLSRMKFCCG